MKTVRTLILLATITFTGIACNPIDDDLTIDKPQLIQDDVRVKGADLEVENPG